MGTKKLRPAMGLVVSVKMKVYFYAGTSWAAAEPAKCLSPASVGQCRREPSSLPLSNHDEQSLSLCTTLLRFCVITATGPSWPAELLWLGEQRHQVLLVGAHAGTTQEETLTNC